MKTKFILFLGSIILSLGLFSMGYKPAHTGSIKVTAVVGDKPSAKALVGIATTPENLENSKYVFEGYTNTTGVVTFKNVAPGTYYVDADLDGFYGEAKVTVADTEASVTVVMKEEEDGDDE